MTFSWLGLKANDVGNTVEWSRLADRSAHVFGTWGGASVAMDGGNVDTSLCPLNTTGGEVISATENSLLGILQIAAYVRPRVIGGDGTTNLHVVMLTRRP